MDPATWLLISLTILASQYAAAKLSDRTPKHEHQTLQPEEILSEGIRLVGEELEEAASETLKPEKEAEQMKAESLEPFSEKPEEESPPQAEKQENLSLEEIEKISAKISELKDLLEMSKALEKELRKLANTINHPKHGKRVN